MRWLAWAETDTAAETNRLGFFRVSEEAGRRRDGFLFLSFLEIHTFFMKFVSWT
jgi:hypothetical protein